MKGVVLAGGLGTRLAPLTNITNKHLLPVYNRAMVTYPIQTLVEAGVEDILLVTGGTHYGQFVQLLQNGEEFGLRRRRYAASSLLGTHLRSLRSSLPQQAWAAGEHLSHKPCSCRVMCTP